MPVSSPTPVTPTQKPKSKPVAPVTPTPTPVAPAPIPTWMSWVGVKICSNNFGPTCDRGNVTIDSSGYAIGNQVGSGPINIDIRGILTSPLSDFVAPGNLLTASCGTPAANLIAPIFNYLSCSYAGGGGNLGFTGYQN